jgi:hypothetical protein
MKFSKSFVQIGSTAAITSLIFITYNLISAEPETVVAFAKSERITRDSALKLRSEYEGFKRNLKVKYKSPATNNDTVATLRGFVMDAAQLREVVVDNHSGQTPDEVVFYFGKQGQFRHGGGLGLRQNAFMHIIVYGRYKGELLDYGTPKASDQGSMASPASIFDKADPCPPNCK